MKRKNEHIWNAIDELTDKVDRLKNLPPDVLDRLRAVEIAIPRMQENLSQLWEREATNNTKKGKEVTFSVRLNDEVSREIEIHADENKDEDLKSLVATLNRDTGKLRDEVGRLNEKIENIKCVWLDWAKRNNRI